MQIASHCCLCIKTSHPSFSPINNCWGWGGQRGKERGGSRTWKQNYTSSIPVLYLRLPDSHFHDSIIHDAHTTAFLKSSVWTSAVATHFFLLIFTGVELLYRVVFISAGQQSESATHTPTAPLVWVPFPSRSPAVKWGFLCYAAGSHGYLFHMQYQECIGSVPISQFISHIPPPPWEPFVCVLLLCLCLLLQMRPSTCHFPRSHTHAPTCICFSLC